MNNAALVMDYQNTHLTTSRLFLSDSPAQNSIINPVLFAKTHRGSKEQKQEEAI